MNLKPPAALDSSVLLDIALKDPVHFETSRQALNQLGRESVLIISPVVYAEVAVHFEDRDYFTTWIEKRPFQIQANNDEVAWWASRFFRRYVKQSSPPSEKRRKILPDFFIAAHAHVHANYLLTRDNDFKKSYFQELKTAHPDQI
ncbi:MAG: type II toxin-antitoxin system VapC family toxin [bacterium]